MRKEKFVYNPLKIVGIRKKENSHLIDLPDRSKGIYSKLYESMFLHCSFYKI